MAAGSAPIPIPLAELSEGHDEASAESTSRPLLVIESQDEALEVLHKYGWWELEYLPLEWRSDREVVHAAIRHSGLALAFASEELRADRCTAIQAVRKCGLALQHASEEIRNDREIVLMAIAHNGNAVQYASLAMRADREVALTALASNGSGVLAWLSEDLRADRTVVERAVSHDAWNLMHASAVMRSDREIVMRALEQDGRALQHADLGFRQDRDVVLQAIRQNSFALKFASPALQADPALVLKACATSGAAFAYAAQELKEDPCFVKQLLAAAPEASIMRHVSPKLLQDGTFLVEALEHADAWACVDCNYIQHCPEDTLQIISRRVLPNRILRVSLLSGRSCRIITESGALDTSYRIRRTAGRLLGLSVLQVVQGKLIVAGEIMPEDTAVEDWPPIQPGVVNDVDFISL